MLKTRILVIISLLLSGVLSVAGLYFAKEFLNRSPNAFIRMFPPHKITAAAVKDLKDNNIYFVGYDDDSIYLGNQQIKNLLYRLNLKNLENSKVILNGSKNVKVLENVYVEVDSAFVYLMDGIKGQINVGNTTDYILTTKFPTPYFTAAVPLSKNSFLFRAVNIKNENFLIKKRLTSQALIVNDRILKKQVDGLFCTDGLFFKVPNTDIILYVYYYRNQFLRIDSNLKVLYTGKTIDTNSLAKIKLARISSENNLTMSAPPVIVNKQASANKNFLFIRSALKADNEIDEQYANAAVIDVYELRNGKYKFSFYLPDFANQKLSDFKIYDNMLVALFGHYIYTFKINF